MEENRDYAEYNIMKAFKYLTVTFIFILMLAGITSCSDTAKKHEIIAEDALASADIHTLLAIDKDDSAESDLLDEYTAAADFSGAYDEIYEQRSAGDKVGDVITYKLSLSFPDISGVPADMVLDKYPDIDWSTAERGAYSESLKENFYNALTEFIKNRKIPYKEYSIEFTFEKNGSEMTAVPDHDDLLTAYKEAMISAENLLKDYTDSSELASVIIAERLNKALENDSRYPTILSDSVILGMETKSNGSYKVKLRVVDYVDLMTVVSEDIYDKYKEENPDGVYRPPEEEITLSMLEEGIKNTEYKPATVDIELESETDDTEYICNMICDIIAGQLEEEVDGFNSRVRSEMIKDSVTEPKTCVLAGTSDSSKGMAFKIHTPANYDSHYIKIIDTSTGEPFMKIYIREGDTITVYLPVGSYRIRYATGEHWYGYDELFGTDGEYFKFNEVVSIKKDTKYTLTLYRESESNLTTSVLDYGEF